MTEKTQLETAAESDAVTRPTVVPGHGYPANRLVSSPEPTGWQNSGTDGKLEKVSRGTSE